MSATLLKFYLAPDTLQFEYGSDYPTTRKHEVLQVSDRSAGGKLQTETLGVNIKTRTLNFTLMPKVDYDALIDWFLDVVNAGEKEFEFTDEYGETGTVVFVDTILEFPENSLNQYSGSFTLEYV